MNYQEALDYIHSTCWKGSRPGLGRTRELTERLGRPQDGLKFIHVAGTNGKGSTSAMPTKALRGGGSRVARRSTMLAQARSRSPGLWE